MARVTVEDCLASMQNRFELVLVASRRARQLARGHEAHLEWENDKPTVMALREIAEGHVDASVLDEIEQAEAISAAEEAAMRERDFEVEAEQAEQAGNEKPAPAEVKAEAATETDSKVDSEPVASDEDAPGASETEAGADEDDAEEKGS